MKLPDSLDQEQQSYNLSGYYQNNNAKVAMQNLYKQQLDQLLLHKNKMKEADKNRDEAERREFNERAISNRQSEKIKDQAYKNYYNMLLTNQEQLLASYVSPYTKRDNMKEQHISHSLQEGEEKVRQWEIEERRKQADRKNQYRNDLMTQIEERKKIEANVKSEEERKKQELRVYGKLPDEVSKYERQKHIEEMEKYKSDLDKFKNQKDQFLKSRTMSEQTYMKLGENQHHALINPVPYNIQNPYILKEMTRQNYLANRGISNLNNEQ